MSRIRLPWAPLLAAACTVAALSACTEGGALLAGAGTASLINTDKTLIDHVASMGPQDCSTVRLSLGDVWCLPDDEGLVAPLPAQTKYCYRTLGNVTCYAQPSPNPHDSLVGIVVPRTRGLNDQ
ncbi:hypothetical protein [Caenispirillum salinarum]|uniref:hypothetical protein n=1 Tax=Caenispirillum salinarum TaxID=859058 RepID=UPI00384F4D4A